MEKINLQLGEFLQLEKELNGSQYMETGEVEFSGFLKQDLPIILKYELTETSEILLNEKKKIETLRDELIKKHGTESTDGSIMVKMILEELNDEGEVISKSVNPEFIKFDEEFGKLLSQEKEIQFPEITKEDLKVAGKTKDNYKVLFKLIKKDSVK